MSGVFVALVFMTLNFGRDDANAIHGASKPIARSHPITDEALVRIAGAAMKVSIANGLSMASISLILTLQ